MSVFESYPRITPFLWFDNNAEEAADLYVSIFKNSRRLDVADNADPAGKPAKVMTVAFELDGLRFTALNGGPAFQFTEAISFVVRCDDQQEVDYFHNAFLASGGKDGQCGWLKDRFGVSWQIVPAVLPELIKHPRVMEAIMKMKKIDIAELERAAKE